MSAGLSSVWGMLAEFDSPEKLLSAVRTSRERGYSAMDAYTPFPIEGLGEALGAENASVAVAAMAGGIAGGVAGYALQYYAMAVAYPIDVGGRPYHSWPAFIPVTFELTVLGAALASLVAMLFFNGLPMPYHPVFHWDRFAAAGDDRFFLGIEAGDSHYHPQATREFLESLEAAEVREIAF